MGTTLYGGYRNGNGRYTSTHGAASSSWNGYSSNTPPTGVPPPPPPAQNPTYVPPPPVFSPNQQFTQPQFTQPIPQAATQAPTQPSQSWSWANWTDVTERQSATAAASYPLRNGWSYTWEGYAYDDQGNCLGRVPVRGY